MCRCTDCIFWRYMKDNKTYGVCIALDQEEIIETCVATDKDIPCDLYVEELDDNETEKSSA